MRVQRAIKAWRRGAVGVVGVAALAGLGPQQGEPKPPPEFQPMDQGVGDRTDLSASYRDTGVELRVPMEFDRVYKVDARSRLLRGLRGFEGGGYARAHGGLVAVFPKSAYRPVAPGVDMAQVPAGTVYTLAESARMNAMHDEKALPTRPSTRIVNKPILTRIETRGDATPQDFPTQARHVSGEGASIFGDEDYRQRRVRELLEWAEHARAVATETQSTTTPTSPPPP